MSKIGRFGNFGGQYVPETVMNAVSELQEAYEKYSKDPEFLKELGLPPLVQLIHDLLYV